MMVHLPEDNLLIASDILVDTIMPSFRDGHFKTMLKPC